MATVGEKARFEACKGAMERLTDVRRRGWQTVEFAQQQITPARIDPRRTSARNQRMGLKVLGNLQSIVRQSDRIATEVRRCFDGLVAPVWIEEYLATRLTPLHEGLSELSAEAGKLK